MNLSTLFADKQIKKGDRKDDVKQKILEVASVTTATGNGDAAANGFWLSNVYPVSATDEVTHPIKPMEGEGEEVTMPADNNITVYIGRVVAKVTPQMRTDAQMIGGTLSDISYRVCNNPKRTYLFSFYSAGTLSSPYFAATWEEGTAGTDSWTEADQSKVNPDSYFGHGDVDSGDPSFTAMNGTNSQYMTENSPGTSNLRRKGTYLSIKGSWVPDQCTQVLTAGASGLGNSNQPGDSWATAKTFYRVAVMGGDNNEYIDYYCPGIYVTTPTSCVDPGKENADGYVIDFTAALT